MKDSLLDDLKKLLIDSVDTKTPIEAPDEQSDEAYEFEEVNVNSPSEHSFRIYNLDECDKIDVDCRNFLLNIEKMNLITVKQREYILDKLMQSDANHVNMDEVRWTVLNALDDDLNEERLLFLDYVLTEDMSVEH